MPNSLITYEERKQVIDNLCTKMLKNEVAISDYIEKRNNLYAVDDRNNRNWNDEYRSNTNLSELISETKTFITHITTVMDKVGSFKVDLMQVIEALENYWNNVNEEETQEQRRERRRRQRRESRMVSEIERNNIIMRNSVSTYQQRYEAIQILHDELGTNEDAVDDYMEAYEYFYPKDENNNDKYRSNTNLVWLIIEMKTLASHVTTVMGKFDAFKFHLMQIIEILEKNLNNMVEEEAQE